MAEKYIYKAKCGATMLLDNQEVKPGYSDPNPALPKMLGVGCPVKMLVNDDGKFTPFAGNCRCGFFVSHTQHAEGDNLNKGI